MDGRKDWRTDGHLYLDARTYVRTDEKRISEKSNHKSILEVIFQWVHWTDGQTDGRTDGIMFSRNNFSRDNFSRNNSTELKFPEIIFPEITFRNSFSRNNLSRNNFSRNNFSRNNLFENFIPEIIIKIFMLGASHIFQVFTKCFPLSTLDRA